MPKTRKTAMVSPVAKPASDLPIFADDDLQLKLLKTLKSLKNDRAYVVLEYHSKWASVHFEGDADPIMIHYK